MDEPSPEKCPQKIALDALALGRCNWDLSVSSIGPSYTLTFEELSQNLDFAPGNLFLHFKSATHLGKKNSLVLTASSFFDSGFFVCN